MNSTIDILDAEVETPELTDLGSSNIAIDDSSDSSTTGTIIPTIQLEEGEIDPRLKLLSHSSRLLLHACPRKYQLYRLASQEIAAPTQAELEQGVTFAYGHAVGIGVASILEGKSEDQILLNTYLAWSTDLLDSNEKQKKSIWTALFAVQKFIKLRELGFLHEWELVYIKGADDKVRPATELGFQILLPEGFRYRGFVDAVLKHKKTDAIMVLECKTSSGTANPAMYKNSGQALGYSVVLDILFPHLSSYTVLYLVYETKSYEYVELPYEKSLLQRALWLQELLIEIKKIELYESFGAYPMHGEACFDWYKPCEYLGLCTLTTERLVKPLTQRVLDDAKEDLAKYEFTVDFHDLVDSQLEKGIEPIPASADVGDGDNIV